MYSLTIILLCSAWNLFPMDNPYSPQSMPILRYEDFARQLYQPKENDTAEEIWPQAEVIIKAYQTYDFLRSLWPHIGTSISDLPYILYGQVQSQKMIALLTEKKITMIPEEYGQYSFERLISFIKDQYPHPTGLFYDTIAQKIDEHRIKLVPLTQAHLLELMLQRYKLFAKTKNYEKLPPEHQAALAHEVVWELKRVDALIHAIQSDVHSTFNTYVLRPEQQNRFSALMIRDSLSTSLTEPYLNEYIATAHAVPATSSDDLFISDLRTIASSIDAIQAQSITEPEAKRIKECYNQSRDFNQSLKHAHYYALQKNILQHLFAIYPETLRLKVDLLSLAQILAYFMGTANPNKEEFAILLPGKDFMPSLNFLHKMISVPTNTHTDSKAAHIRYAIYKYYHDKKKEYTIKTPDPFYVMDFISDLFTLSFKLDKFSHSADIIASYLAVQNQAV